MLSIKTLKEKSFADYILNYSYNSWKSNFGSLISNNSIEMPQLASHNCYY